MSVEEKAKESWWHNGGMIPQDSYTKAYITGYNEAMNTHGIKWHDLRKNPNDLPREENDYLLCLYDKETKSVFYEVMGLAKRYADSEDWYVESMIWNIEDVIAWTEIPQFKEIKEK